MSLQCLPPSSHNFSSWNLDTSWVLLIKICELQLGTT
jgi:hypothetical protein